MIISVNVFVVG